MLSAAVACNFVSPASVVSEARQTTVTHAYAVGLIRTAFITIQGHPERGKRGQQPSELERDDGMCFFV